METVTLRSAEIFQPSNPCRIKLPNFKIFLLMKPPLVFSIKPLLIQRLSALRSPLEPCPAETAPVIKFCHLDLRHFLPLRSLCHVCCNLVVHGPSPSWSAEYCSCSFICLGGKKELDTLVWCYSLQIFPSLPLPKTSWRLLPPPAGAEAQELRHQAGRAGGHG